LAAALKSRHQAEVTLTPGSGGVLDVAVDGQIIFSKAQAGHFPTAEELLPLLPP